MKPVFRRVEFVHTAVQSLDELVEHEDQVKPELSESSAYEDLDCIRCSWYGLGMPTPDTRSSIVVYKTISYRGLDRLFSNRYHFEGDTPADNSHWTTLADAIVAAEKAIYDSSISIVEVVGNDKATATSTNPHGDAVFTKTYTTAGTGSFSGDGRRAPGDCVSLLRYSTPARTGRNHPVYLFNYFHGVFQTTGDPDVMSPTQKTAVQLYGTEWIAGFSDGTENHERCGPRGAVAVSRLCDGIVRHRDFPA